MLPPFHIRNITSPLDTVRISAPAYDDTLSNNPKAALTYDDDDGDLITVCTHKKGLSSLQAYLCHRSAPHLN